MSYNVKAHKLTGDKVQQVACPGKDSGLFTAGLPDMLVIHFTGGGSLDSSVNHLKDPGIKAKHRNEPSESYWHTYSEALLTACFAVCRCLVNSYPINTIVGHEEISPGRKIDPGPAFPLERLRDQILVGRTEAPSVSPDRVGCMGII
jgi:hypothetical protein